MKMNLKYICVLLFWVTYHCFAQHNVGDRCKVRETNTPGVCKLITNCPEANQQGVTATTCGFYHGRIPIVCCEAKKVIKPIENVFVNHNKQPEFTQEGIIFPVSSEDNLPATNQFQSKSEEKCNKYSESVMGIVNAAPLITDPEAVVSIDVVKCDNGLPLVVGGAPAAPGEFPFMAAIGYNTGEGTGWYCGGTLISHYFVVTAAHCDFSRDYGRPVKVRLGEIDLSKDDDGTEYKDYIIADIKVHDQYRPPVHYHDIALIRLTQRVEFTKFIRPACLWNKFEVDNNISIATGWGKTGYVEEQSNKLLKVVLSIYENSLCARTYQSESLKLPKGITSNMICAGWLKGGRDTCQGDSGGPLIITNPLNRCISYLIGVTSFGKGCGGPNLPAVYTRISNYLPWIEKHIW